MRLDDLRTLLILDERRNLHRAAEQTGLTQSALSKSLARLETAAGARLFERTPRGLVVTRAGETLVRHARRVALAVGDMEKELADQRAARAGSVRLGALPLLVASVLSPLLATFFVSRPLTSFSIETHLSARLFELLGADEVDMVLAAVPNDPVPGATGLPLGPLEMQIVARSGHPRRAGFRTLHDLTGERWIVPAAPLYLRQWLDQRFLTVGLPAPRVAVESTASPVAFAELLRHSDLLAIMPPQTLKQPEGRGLAALTGNGMSWAHELGVFWRADGYLSPICEDFRAAVVEWSREHR